MAATLHEKRRKLRSPPIEGMRSRLRRRLKYVAYGAVAIVALVAAGRAIAHNPTCSSERAHGGVWAFRAELDNSSPVQVCYAAVPRQYISHWDTSGKVTVTNTSDRPVEVEVDWRLRTGPTLSDGSQPRTLAPGESVKYSTALRVGESGTDTEMRVRVFADGDRIYRSFATAPTHGLFAAYLGWLALGAVLVGLAIWVLLGREHTPHEDDEDVRDAEPHLGNYVWPKA